MENSKECKVCGKILPKDCNEETCCDCIKETIIKII